MLYEGMTYSVDLRERVIRFVQEGGSKVEAARHFNVSRWCVYNWFKREKIAPKAQESRQNKLVKADLLTLVQTQNDLRLADYAAQLGVTTQAVWYAFKRWGITKKNDPLSGKSVYETH